jgi:twitching motility protein PilT
MEQQAFVAMLQSAFHKGVSDVHLAAGSSPAFRIRGEVRNVTTPPLNDGDIMKIIHWIISDKSTREKISELQDYDGSFEVKNLCRFRYNVCRQRNGFSIILRLIPIGVPTIAEMNFPKVLYEIADIPRGLVLVTGATGSGKSTTLAAMIDHINSNSYCHILTIEDPIEFLHTQKKSRITQREIGSHTASFAGALRSALRQDPDVILVGEMRDPETIDVALKAAETGHRVFSTVHTPDAMKTIGRLISVFPPNEQKMARLRFADNLKAIISQRLLKRNDKKGMIAAQEIMITNTGIQECIANPDLTNQMNEYISKSNNPSGGQTFDQHLIELYKSGTISLEEAKEASSHSQDFERNLLFQSNGSAGQKTGEVSSPKLSGLNDVVQLERKKS